jgi:hypothetical protein
VFVGSEGSLFSEIKNIYISALSKYNERIIKQERSTTLAKPNFDFQKRQKELAKKKKNEEKKQRKLEKNKPESVEHAEPQPEPEAR